MVGYWDTSAIVPLLVSESSTPLRESQLRASSGMITWWGTRIECVSALCRRVREGMLSPEEHAHAMNRLEALSERWIIVEASKPLQLMCEELLRDHPLRAADAIQLSSAIMACEGSKREMPFHTADNNLASAAERAGFRVV